MAEHVGSTLQGNDKLRSKLFSDDTEKLRRKLAYLQREYSKTQQRLKRAERSEAVKKHVRTRITEQNSLQLPQVDPDASTTRPNVDSSSPSHRLGSPTCQITGPPRDQDHTEGRVEADGGRKSTAVRFLLPSEAAAAAAAAPPLTPASGQDARAQDRRPGPAPGSALRLRSRSSRLRWQRRCSGSAEAIGRTDANGEEAPEPGGRPGDSGGTPEVAAETQETKEGRRSGSDPGSPSLLLTHWNAETRAAGAAPETTGRAAQRENGTGEDEDGESPSLLLPHWTPAPPAGRRAREDAPDHKGTDAAEAERAGGLESEVNAGEPRRRDREADGGQNGEGLEEGKAGDGGSRPAVGPTADRQRGGCEGDGGRRVGEASLRASFWPVEGLLFPPEYYVRTTRRMTSSQQQQQQQQDMQGSLFSDLIGTTRTRGRGQNPGARQDRQDHSGVTRARPDGPAQTGSSGSSHEAQSSSEKASEPSADDQNHECVGAAAPGARPARGRKRKRGRPRGRSFDRGSCCSNASRADREPTAHRRGPAVTPRSPSQCPPVAVLEPGRASPAPAFVPQPSASPLALPPGVPPSAPGDGPASARVSGCLEQVYPIFRGSGSVTERPPHDVCWRSLLLPSPPGPGGPLLQLPRLAPGPAAEAPVATDFHLPDEQFGSLKLHKLRQAMEAEPFSAPSYHTRRSSQQAYHLYAAAAGGERDAAAAAVLSLPLSPTPPLSESVLGGGGGGSGGPRGGGDLRRRPAVAPARPIGERGRMDARVRPGSTPDAGVDSCTLDRPGGGGPPTGGPEPVGPGAAGSPAGRSTGECVDETSAGREPSTGTAPEGSAEHLPPPPVLTERQERGGGDVVVSENRGAAGDHQRAEEDDDDDCDSPAEETVKSRFKCNSNCPTIHGRMDPAVQEDQRTTCLADRSPPDHRTAGSPPDGSAGGPPPCPGACSQLLLSPALVSPPCPLLAPPLLPSTGPPSPPLPSLGLTPRPALASRLPLTSSPCAPRLALPSPVSPSSLALSPPDLSPCPFPLSPAPASHRQTSACLDPPLEVGGQRPGAVPGRGPPDSVAGGPVDPQPPRAAGAADRTEGAAGEPAAVAEECAVSIAHTLTAPAGGGLVDACCVPGPAGGLCVAAAGKWAVCVWDQTSSSSSGWGLIHTWTFNKPVISVFSVPDSAGLLCVTLGQLEIREVRVLSCSSLVEAPLCQGVVQAVVAVARARVVCSSHSAAVSALQLFVLSEDSSAPAPQPLASPGMRVGALATVDGLPDALLGSAEGGHLFLWNLGTGQLLQRILLDKGLTHTACLRGYSYSGVLFVLLQHQYLGSIAREEVQPYHRDSGVVSMEERPKTTLFSLVAVNALSGKSVVANRLHQPEAWSGRLCEADVLGSRLVALSQSGSVHVWDLGGPGGPRAAWAPEADGWRLARWGAAADTLVTGHQNGDLTLHRYGDRRQAAVLQA